MPATPNIFRKTLQQEDWLIIVANLIPVAGVWFFDWSAVDAFIVYALETIIIGMLTVIKLTIAAVFRGSDNWYTKGLTVKVSGLFFIVFFILHFGIFVAVQTSILASVAGIIPPGKGVMYFFFHWWEYVTSDIAWMLGGFVVSYLLRDFVPFLLRKEFSSVSMMLLMFQPYGRVIIQQFTVILGAMFLSLGSGDVFILVFAAVKILVEAFVNYDSILNRSRQQIEQQSGK